MESSITPERIANAILQDKSYNGYHLLVEGKKDIPLYKKLINNECVKLTPTFGKYKMRSAIEILSSRGFDKKFGIRDADFIRVRGNLNLNYGEKIFITDAHDAESMIINQDCFYDFINVISTEDKIESFVESHGDIRELIYKLSYPIGCLRLANKIHDLGLSFKPERTDGNKPKLKNFISEENFSYIGHDALINTMVNYSINRGKSIADKKTILSKLNEILLLKYSPSDIVNGHDLSEILLLICKKGLKSNHKALVDADCIETLLTLSFNHTNFSKTQLFTSLDDYQKTLMVNFISM
ncbi:DUF4435 domain-containing protein [Aeromonas hydrophila]|uniref:DUF4435 domain-containing protein n=1 Tax=Aeromonas hydrophila TaxID=644 RepID=UPI0038CF63BE